jgi:hypothetical protein
MKLRGLRNVTSDTELFALVLATHPAGPVDSGLKQIAKHSSGIASAVKARGDANAVAERARRYLESRLKHLGDLHTGEFRAGEAYGVPVEIHYWLVGPIADGAGDRVNRVPRFARSASPLRSSRDCRNRPCDSEAGVWRRYR